MAEPLELHTPQSSVSPEGEQDFIKIVYKEISENSRYYDAHIWQIPSVTMAVNAFLIGQAFSQGIVNTTRFLMVLGALFFTFVLLIALVKHSLHRAGQDKNIQKIEQHLHLPSKLHKRYDFRKPKVLRQVVDKPNIFERLLAPRRANTWLMSVMGVTIIIDFVILVGVLLNWR